MDLVQAYMAPISLLTTVASTETGRAQARAAGGMQASSVTCGWQPVGPEVCLSRYSVVSSPDRLLLHASVSSSSLPFLAALHFLRMKDQAVVNRSVAVAKTLKLQERDDSSSAAITSWSDFVGRLQEHREGRLKNNEVRHRIGSRGVRAESMFSFFLVLFLPSAFSL